MYFYCESSIASIALLYKVYNYDIVLIIKERKKDKEREREGRKEEGERERERERECILTSQYLDLWIPSE